MERFLVLHGLPWIWLFELLEIVWLFLSTSFCIFRVSKLCLFGVASFSAASIHVVFEGTIWVLRCFFGAIVAVDYRIIFSFFNVSHLLSSRLMGFVLILLFLFYHRFFINFLSLRSIYLWKISIFQPVLRVVFLYCISWSITIPFFIGTVIYFIQFFHTGIMLWTWPTLTFLTIISWPISIRTLQDGSKSWIIIVIVQFLLNVTNPAANLADIRLSISTKILHRVTLAFNFRKIGLIISQRFKSIHA